MLSDVPGPELPRLIEASVPLISMDRCRQAYQKGGDSWGAALDPQQFICGWDEKKINPQDACNGDSGGPAFVTQESRQQLVGMIAAGVGCGGYPGVYTNLSTHRPWVQAHVGG